MPPNSGVDVAKMDNSLLFLVCLSPAPLLLEYDRFTGFSSLLILVRIYYSIKQGHQLI
jgi:hypothetical protein